MGAASTAVRAAPPRGTLRLVRRAFEALALGALPLAVVALSLANGSSWLGFDLRAFYRAGGDVLAGRSPYRAFDAATIESGHFFVYPPAAAWLFTPLSLVPWSAAVVVMYLASLAMIGAALYLLGVRDPRMYGITVLWNPTLFALNIGTISPLMLLLAAVAWRWRERAAVSGGAVGAAVVAKLLLWPLVVWLCICGRLRAAAIAAVGAAVLITAGFAAGGVGEWRAYLELLQRLSAIQGPRSASIYALGVHAGLPVVASRAAVAALAAALFVAAWRVRRGTNAERRVFLLCALAALVATPILWTHYLVLLVLPLALAYPRRLAPWTLPLAIWLVDLPAPEGLATAQWIGVVWLTTAAVFGLALRRLARPDLART